MALCCNQYTSDDKELNEQLITAIQEDTLPEEIRVKRIQELLELGANPNATNNEHEPALWVALGSNNNKEVIRLLLEYGADADAETTGGYSIMFWPVADGDVENVELLLKYCSDINKKVLSGNNGFKTLLWIAANQDEPEVAFVLIKAGADTRVLKEGKLRLSQQVLIAIRNGLIARQSKSIEH